MILVLREIRHRRFAAALPCMLAENDRPVHYMYTISGSAPSLMIKSRRRYDRLERRDMGMPSNRR